jgi:hypothetical protein
MSQLLFLTIEYKLFCLIQNLIRFVDRRSVKAYGRLNYMISLICELISQSGSWPHQEKAKWHCHLFASVKLQRGNLCYRVVDAMQISYLVLLYDQRCTNLCYYCVTCWHHLKSNTVSCLTSYYASLRSTSTGIQYRDTGYYIFHSLRGHGEYI